MNTELKKFSQGLAEAVKAAAAGTVTVRARRRLPASGIALDAETILTAAHVIEDGDNIMVVLPDGTESAATLAGYDPNSDLAVLTLAEGKASPAKVQTEAAVGELVLALGRPFGRIEASLGTLSAIGGPTVNRRGGTLEGHFRTDTTPFPGFSGGPLVNVSGEVVGINTSGLGFGDPIAVPMPVALKIAEQLKKHGSIKRGFLGISGQPVELPEAGVKALKRKQASGLLIVGIEADSPATGSGLLIGDILVGLAGQPVESHRTLLSLLTGELVGQETELQMLRGGKPETLKVTIGERPEHSHDEHPGKRFRSKLRRWHGGRRGHHGHHGRHHEDE
jgi:S1-C subfamily serine protease